MEITINITEQPNGDVAVHVRAQGGYVTTREDRYADEITKSIKAHLAREMPAIVKRILAAEGN